MKKFIVIAIAALFLISACKKTRTTGHLYVNVNMAAPLTAQNVPSSFHTIAGGSLVTPTDANVLNTAADNSNNRSSKVLDFGELKPGTYLVDSIHGYAYNDSASYILGAGVSSSPVTIKAEQDQTLTITF